MRGGASGPGSDPEFEAPATAVTIARADGAEGFVPSSQPTHVLSTLFQAGAAGAAVVYRQRVQAEHGRRISTEGASARQVTRMRRGI